MKPQSLTRRTLMSLLPAAGLAGLNRTGSSALLAATSDAKGIGRDRISAITDEIAMSPEEAIAFAHHYGLTHLELRDVPTSTGRGEPYFFLPEEKLRPAAKAFREAGIKISFLNSSLCKGGLPGAAPEETAKHNAGWRAQHVPAWEKEYAERYQRLEKCLRAAAAFECPYIRIFTFLRVSNPSSVQQRVADVIGDLAERTHKAGFMLLVENEASCNVGDSGELAAMMGLLPEKTVGFNWDGRNALTLGETPFPDGYRKLPKNRMKNAQIKGHDMLDPEHPIDWAPILKAMNADGFQGCIGLETHYFDGTKLERSHLAMDKILKLVDTSQGIS